MRIPARKLSLGLVLAAGVWLAAAALADDAHWDGEWETLPADFPDFQYSEEELHALWDTLHLRDGLPWPDADYVSKWGESAGNAEAVAASLVEGWRLYHAGEFQRAYEIGTEAGPAGNLLAGRAWLTYASHVPEDSEIRAAMLAEGSERFTQRMEARDGETPAWEHMGLALMLGQYSKTLSTGRAVREGIPGTVRDHLDKALDKHPDLPAALGTYGGYHTELIDRVGGMLARMTYGASRDAARDYFERALEADPKLVMARTEFGEALLRLDDDANWDNAMRELEKAVGTKPLDADDELERRRAVRLIEEWTHKREGNNDTLPDLGG
ncbi:MAG: hypothetical protein JJU06_14690 [Ectothiorhodospiraceae bacterium]|nr:hypothetical protein [Ectothiorhodospiraceae bacterium]MCH8503006.1 hypothetical protein [Ectothiorhodospiraceae bacterium]